MNSLIPGTDLTKAELNEKVMSQLMRHKMVAEDRKVQKETENTKLLQRRENLEENLLTKSLEKSVTFKDPESDLEGEVGDLETRDSGRGSSYDLELSDLELDETGGESEPETRDVAVGTDRSLLFRRKIQRSQKKPPWRYWNNESAPELLEPMHEGPYRVGPYEEAYTMGPVGNQAMYRGNRCNYHLCTLIHHTVYFLALRLQNYYPILCNLKSNLLNYKNSNLLLKPSCYAPTYQLIHCINDRQAYS
jgi:hypothetical protein